MHQFIQVDLGEETPIYGIELAGSRERNSYVTTFKVLYGDDGNIFSYIEEFGHPKVYIYFFLCSINLTFSGVPWTF